MDSLCLKAGIHTMAAPIVSGAALLDVRTNQSHITASVGRSPLDKPSVLAAAPPQRSGPWGFTFRYPLRSLWPGGGKRYDAIAVDDAVSVEQIEQEKGGGGAEEEIGGDARKENWVLKILHVKSMWKDTRNVEVEELVEDPEESTRTVDDRNRDCSGDDTNGDEECDLCSIDHDDNDDKIKFDKDSFSKLLRRVSLPEARLYAQMSYLGSLAYCIPQIKPGNLLKRHSLKYITSSLEKKEEEKLKEEKETADSQNIKEEEKEETREKKSEEMEDVKNKKKKDNERRISASVAYEIAASAASYLHTHTKSIIFFRTSKSESAEDDGDDNTAEKNIAGISENIMNNEMASLAATTDSVTSVVAAKEEVKQAVADNLSSRRSSPCEWFICDDDETATRYFVIQGSESLASWQANLLFEPAEFEGLDVLVHRGIYEAAKGIYEQMLPEVHAHLETHGDRATFRFTGHSLGGSLSVLVNLMLLIRGGVPPHSLLPVITFGAPSIVCGGDRLLKKLGLPRSHIQAITMHRDIVPRAFSCNYPSHVAEFLKAVNGNFRNLPCLSKQKLLYAPMGELLILQPDQKFSPSHELLPSGSGLYLLISGGDTEEEGDTGRLVAAQCAFLNSPHPLEILSDRGAYGSSGTVQRDHDMNSYLRCVRGVIREELNQIRKGRRENRKRRRSWWPILVSTGGGSGGAGIMRGMGVKEEVKFSGMVQNGRESLRRFSRLVASQHMHLLVLLLFPAKMLILGTFSVIMGGGVSHS
ncbi:phospholipase A1 PLIP2, chloroplastic [Impatiens glandulifera]|uniref:phospholipase A1 PLIP2, chloroplastic n=1 Tax=Impatiens glandulifera TaxID=253017 RepID=UPI001FB0E801|nr:phospholipase A1 PLIP2, chloroplastic [Impatiens glandulifera]